eukprot:m.1041088 g.1041088  ORF g.1041088 m.1041088 type:complete len:55 (+) comp24156_c1_seq1:1654-1818(+)
MHSRAVVFVWHVRVSSVLEKRRDKVYVLAFGACVPTMARPSCTKTSASDHHNDT